MVSPAAPRRRLVPPGRLDLYLLRGLIAPFLLAFGLTVAAMMLERSLRLIYEMAASGAHLGYFFPLLLQLVPYYVAMALPASFMIALIFLIARLDESLELEAILASGVSLARISFPLIGFGLLVAGAALLAIGVLEPHGRYGMRMLRAAALQEARVGELQPGAFYSPADGLTLTFRKRGGETGEVRDVFVRHQASDGPERLLTARRAILTMSPPGGALQIALEDGLIYQPEDRGRGRRALSVDFRRYRISEPFPGLGQVRPRGGDQKELTVGELLRELRSGSSLPPAAVEAELYSRLARSLSALFLPLLAIPLAFAAKKGRRGLGIFIGGALLMTFHHTVNLVKNVTLDGSPAPGPAFALLSAAFAAFALWLFVASRHLPSHGPLTSLFGRLRPAGSAARPPRARLLRLPGGTIGSYVARSFLLWSGAAALTIVVLLQMVDLFERGDDFVDRGFSLAESIHYMMLRLPLLLQQGIAIAALGGAMLALLRLTHFSELVAIRGMGVSLRRLLLMLLPVAVALSAATLLLSERVTPRTEVALASWWRSTDDKADRSARWFRIGRDIASARQLSPDGGRIDGLVVYRLDRDGRLTERIAADSATEIGGAWELESPEAVRISGGALAQVADTPPLWRGELGREEIRDFFAASPLISSEAAERALAGFGPLAEGPPRFETRLHRRLAEPLAPIVMLLLALPIALASSRTGPSWPRLLFPIVSGMAFLVSDGVLTVAAQVGMVNPWIGAWAAPFAFGILGASLLVYSDS